MQIIEPLVSVITITYNHEPFIAKMIESVLMQQTNFPVEFIIAEDCSTDNTRKIVLDYVNRYPELIKIITSENNVGAVANERRAMLAARGKYIAFCEGDDYWTDPLKLQKQVNYMELHPECSLTCHRYQIFDCESNQLIDDDIEKFLKDDFGFEINLNLFFEKWIIKSLTLVYSKTSFDPEIILQYKHYRDLHLIYHLLTFNNGFCLNFVGGVYNMHEGGIHSKINNSNQCINAVIAANDLYSMNKNKQLKDYYLDKLQWAISVLMNNNTQNRLLIKFIFRHFIFSRSIYQFSKNVYHYILSKIPL